MRTRKLLFGLISLAANSTLLIGTAHADRRSGLAGNLLIEDPDDLFAFPQLTLLHRNMFRLDYGGSAQSGNGVLTLGNEREAVGLAIHRGDLLSPDVVGFNTELAWLGGVEGVGGPLGNSSFGSFVGPDAVDADDGPVLPATVVDLSYARSLNGNPFGVRLGFGRGVQARKDASDDVEKGAQTFIAAQVGYSERPSNLDAVRWDASGNVVLGFGNSSDAAGDDENSAWALRVAGLGRAYYPLNRLVDVGVIANVSFANEHSENAQNNDESSDLDFGVRAGVGPSIHLDRAKIAAYGGLRLGAGKNQPTSESDQDVSRLRLAVPMVNMAAEIQVLDWLYVRTGAEYRWELRREATEDVKERVADGAFAWSAGLGFQRGSFYFDGVVTNGFVTGGPNFIGGTSPGFLAMASLTYKFGDVFGDGQARADTATDASRPLVVERPRSEPVVAPDNDRVVAPANDRVVAPAPVVTPLPATEPDQELAAPPVSGRGVGTTRSTEGAVDGRANGNLRIGN
jgi:hypothetical protein